MQRSTDHPVAQPSASADVLSTGERPTDTGTTDRGPTATEEVYGLPGWLLGPGAVLVAIGWAAYLAALAIGAVEL